MYYIALFYSKLTCQTLKPLKPFNKQLKTILRSISKTSKPHQTPIICTRTNLYIPSSMLWGTIANTEKKVTKETLVSHSHG